MISLAFMILLAGSENIPPSTNPTDSSTMATGPTCNKISKFQLVGDVENPEESLRISNAMIRELLRLSFEQTSSQSVRYLETPGKLTPQEVRALIEIEILKRREALRKIRELTQKKP